jgi:hypothetical protein
MTIYEDEQTLVEIIRTSVLVHPVPLADVARAKEIHALFPESEGWTHYHCSARRKAEGWEEATEWADDAAARLGGAGVRQRK